MGTAGAESDGGHVAVVEPSTNATRHIQVELAVLALVPFAVAVLVTFVYTLDDPLITLRYASNLVNGNGAVFNLNQHVQGFSSPLDLGIKAVLVAVPGGHDLLKAKLESLTFGVLALWEATRLLAMLPVPRWATRLGAVLAGSSFVVVASSSNGLETALAMWLTTALLVRLVSNRATRAPVPTALVAGAMVLARPEAALLVLGLAVAAVLMERVEPWWRRASWVLGPLVIGTAYLVASWIYYGDPLPNTYAAKAGPLIRSVKRGIKYLPQTLQPQIEHHAQPLLVVLIVIQVVLVGIGTLVVLVDPKLSRWRFLVVAFVLQGVFILKAGGDWMGGGRFLAPVVLAMLVLEVVGLAWCVGAVQGPSWRRAVAVGSGALLLAVVAAVPYKVEWHPIWSTHGRFDDQSLVASGGTHLNRLWTALPSVVSCAGTGATVATSEVGYLGYQRLDLDLVDLRGLTDRFIAQEAPASIKNDTGVTDTSWQSPDSVVGRRILATRPTIIVDFDAEPRQRVLGGRYVLARVLPRSLGGPIRPSVYVQADSDDACARQSG